MARTIIAKKTITFYEGDEHLLQAIEEAAKNDKRNLTSFIMVTLEEKVLGSDKKESTSTITQDSKDALNGW